MRILKWTGVCLTAAGLIGLPVAIWVSGRWGIVFATAGTVGLALLGFASRFSRSAAGEDAGPRAR